MGRHNRTGRATNNYLAPAFKLLVLLSFALISACASTSGRVPVGSNGGSVVRADDGPVKIGRPYTINGRTYYPADERDYDTLGIASWYGPQFHGKQTANGEIFDMNEVSAAHPTLPLPSYVEVTNLANGRTMLVRINDRGPFARGRIIDLSRRAAQLLGFEDKGTQQVRVRRVYPTRTGSRPQVAQSAPTPSVAPMATPPVSTDLPGDTAEVSEAAKPVAPVPTPDRGNAPGLLGDPIYVQVAALGNEEAALRLAFEVRRFGAALVAPADGGLYRIKVGPFLTRDAAETVRAKMQAEGYREALVLARPVS